MRLGAKYGSDTSFCDFLLELDDFLTTQGEIRRVLAKDNLLEHEKPLIPWRKGF